MKSAESPITLHVFVCTNQKPPGKACCALSGGKELRDELKDRMAKKHPELKSKVRINASGCLDKCTEGVACVIYPQGEWITHASLKDLDQLEEKILALVKNI